MHEFEKVERRSPKNLDVIPILNLMTMVIFFLLLAASFIEFTKITVPPSSVSEITSPIVPPPVTPRIVLLQNGTAYRLMLSWQGRQGGAISKVFKSDSVQVEDGQDAVDVYAIEIMKLVREAVEEFKQKFPNENTFQMGMTGDTAYQNLIAMMDGTQLGAGAPDPSWTEEERAKAAKVFKPVDIVLFSHYEADAEAKKYGEDL